MHVVLIVCCCIVCVVVLTAVIVCMFCTGKEEQLWPIVRLIINQSINQGITINKKLQWAEHISNKLLQKRLVQDCVSYTCRNLQNHPSFIKNSCYK